MKKKFYTSEHCFLQNLLFTFYVSHYGFHFMEAKVSSKRKLQADQMPRLSLDMVVTLIIIGIADKVYENILYSHRK